MSPSSGSSFDFGIEEEAEFVALGVVAPEAGEAAEFPCRCAASTAQVAYFVAAQEFAQNRPIAADGAVALCPFAKVERAAEGGFVGAANWGEQHVANGGEQAEINVVFGGGLGERGAVERERVVDELVQIELTVDVGFDEPFTIFDAAVCR